MTPHVCHLAKYYPPAAGGIETHVQALARGQRELGLRVSVLVVNHRDAAGSEVFDHRWRSTPAAEDLDDGVRIIRAGRLCSLSKWDYCPKLPRMIRALQTPGPDRVDLLHLHNPNATMTLALRTAGVKTPLVVTHHSDVVKQRILARGLEWLERRLLAEADAILTTSPNYAAGSAQLRPYLDKVQSLPLGVDLEPFLRPSPEALRHRDELRRRFTGPIWISVGRLVYYKGLATAIEALPSISGTLVIIGEGPLRRELERQAVALGVADRVAWLGKVSGDALVGAYHAATALLFPSNARSEGFGLVQVEAMASGCPVINTNIPHSGVAWVCPHDESGLTVRIGSPAELAQAAKRLADDEALRTRLSQGAVRRACSLFSYESMARTSLEIYDRVLGGEISKASLPDSTGDAPLAMHSAQQVPTT
jgi:glycosyltransferase involved in cell wall biosynthesis